ncbi:LacI family DNA-binding transcriptional regulator [Paracidobacterium acidisoli]|uniref:LacI family transcriptional regulator n=1 Tax=Paracidobacterium acidisoli TaxID=2303751 RepID=A0A372IK88_9BACT|nr:LacI family DNA-binding transcriptional regulator [Paracidobacterium acidisoli]MBT9332750.1 LacI family transcriptional regulator [Paracidobacterium acidisoli]
MSAVKRKPRQPVAGRKRLDIRDVAHHARVSIATVSRTINRVPTVDQELAKRVWKAIEELNYFPNTQARALVSGRSHLMGLLISEITNPFFPELIQGFEEIAVKNGYEILIGSTSYDLERMDTCIRRMLERNVDGVAVMTFGIEEPLLEEFASRNIPMVFVDSGPPSPLVSALVVNYRHGIREGVQHLAALGHRHLGFISGPLQQRSCQLRKAAFLDCCAEIGLKPLDAWLVEGDHTLEGGMRAMERLLAAKEHPTAVMCSNDMTAIGALRVLSHKGMNVPEDLSIIGFDDIHLAEFVHPPLTTVRMSRTDLARAAFEALRSHIEKPDQPALPSRYPVTTRLTVRQSTSYPPGVSISNGKRTVTRKRKTAAK